MLLLFLCCFAIDTAQAQWNNMHTIGTATGRYSFHNQQVPDALTVIVQPYLSAANLQYQWEQSSEAESGFQPIAGATDAVYQFSAPLNATSFFRRKTTLVANGSFIYSNTVKMELVPRSWENANYVREHVIRIPGITATTQADALTLEQKIQSTTYLDGFGRTIQTVQKNMAASNGSGAVNGDVIQPVQYDLFGRQPKSFLPYTSFLSTDSGKFRNNAIQEVNNYYNTVFEEQSPFAQNQFEESPLNRVLRQNAPGTAWAASAGTQMVYDVNTAEDSVRILTIGTADTTFPLMRGFYAVGSLYKQVSIDENNAAVITYTDFQGQLILKKVQLAASPASGTTGWICTYHVYDDFGRLRFQIQPEGVRYLETNNWVFTNSIVQEQCFVYRYDLKGRNNYKKSPGAAALRMWYDKRDRTVFMQDGNQATKPTPQYTANLYDDLDRLQIQLLYNTAKSTAQLQADIDNAVSNRTDTTTMPGTPITDLYLNRRADTRGQYTASNTIEFIADADGEFSSNPTDEFEAFIQPGATTPPVRVVKTQHNNPIAKADLDNPLVSTVLKYLYYDDYNFAGVRSFNNNLPHSSAYPYTISIRPQTATQRTLNLPTGSSVRVLGTNLFLSTTQYYNEETALIQSIEENVRSGADISSYQYHWDGRLLSTVTRHQLPGNAFNGYIQMGKYEYDAAGRPTALFRQFGSNSSLLRVATFAYDDLGRLATKKLAPNHISFGVTGLETLQYSYNLHGNITGINKDYALKTPGKYNKWGNYFGLYIGYDNKDGVFSNSLLTGQVSGVLWNTLGDDAQRRFNFTYDNAARLTTAAFTERRQTTDTWSATQTDFSVGGPDGAIQYDLNGNLLAMQQKGIAPAMATPVMVDDLRYTYATNSNRLARVSDLAGGAHQGKLGDFKDTTLQADDYVYDANGNLIADLNKAITAAAGTPGVVYNHLDKPERIQISGKGELRMVYDANGRLLQKGFTNSATGLTSVQTYIQAMYYREQGRLNNNAAMPLATDSLLVLQHIAFEEGRLRLITPVNINNNNLDALFIVGNIPVPDGRHGVVDYFVKDYQQNVRMVLTTQTHLGFGTATMEQARATAEEAVFGQTGSANELVATRTAKPIGWQANTSAFASRLSKSNNTTVGPNTLMRVMGGDAITATVQYYYQAPVVNNSGTGGNLAGQVISSLIGALLGNSNVPIATKQGTVYLQNGLGLNPAFLNTTEPDAGNAAGSMPKAYLGVLFFDERLNFIAESSSLIRVSQQGDGATPLVLGNIRAPRNGYAYVYVSNESNEPVFFDDLKVQHRRSALLEETHYYPFGLTMAGISSKKLGSVQEGLLKNEYGYNEKELWDEADLYWYEYGFRNYDAQIGRFPQLDPLTWAFPALTPYQYASNDPITNIDLDGLEGVSSTGLVDVIVKSSSTASKVGSGLSTLSIIGMASGAMQLGTTAANLSILKGARESEVSRNSQAGVLNGVKPGVSNLDLKATNDGFKKAGYVEGGIGATQLGMLRYRQSLSLNNKIGTFSRFRTGYVGLSSVRGVLGNVGFAGLGVSVYSDINLLTTSEKSEQIGVMKFAYRTTGNISGAAVGMQVGRLVGGPYGAVAGVAVGFAFEQYEQAYDMFMKWVNEELVPNITNAERGLSTGTWMPRR